MTGRGWLAAAAAIVPGLAFGAALEPAAVLRPVTVIGGADTRSGVDRVAETPANLFAELEPIATRRLASGVVVRVWRYTTEAGTCQARREGVTCARQALLISTSPEAAGGAEFGLWTSSARVRWISSPSQPNAQGRADGGLDYRLEACEASSEVDSGEIQPRIGDDWREVAYGLEVGSTGAVSFVRLPQEAPPRGCFRG